MKRTCLQAATTCPSLSGIEDQRKLNSDKQITFDFHPNENMFDIQTFSTIENKQVKSFAFLKKLLMFLVLTIFGINYSFSQWNRVHNFTSMKYTFDKMRDCRFSFSDPDNGYAFYIVYFSPSSGSFITVEKTTDSGRSWNTVYQNSGYLSISDIISTHPDSVMFFSVWQGFCDFYYSYDSGKSWNRKRISGSTPGDIFFLNSKLGYMVSTGSNKKDWLTKFTNDSIEVVIRNDSINLTNSKIFFLDPLNGYVTAKNPTNNQILLHTKDGGMNWDIKYETSLYTFNDLYFISDSVGFIACSSGKILKTNDSGLHFTELETPKQFDLLDIQFINDSLGYAVGKNGTCIYTINQGKDWSIENTNISADLLQIQMFSKNIGYTISSSFALFEKKTDTHAYKEREQDIRFYPNPTKGLLNIECHPGKQIERIIIYNIHGQKKEQLFLFDHCIDLSHFERGTYILEAFAQDQNFREIIILK